MKENYIKRIDGSVVFHLVEV
ncbi:hypothetical protein YERSI8AC_10096 [Enterobacterales bacterium 8AC]|nr:hypothetical protein YERSI8AC_10096 [Enterobacterales bacterium 8AC]